MVMTKTKHAFLMKKRYYGKKIQYFLMRHAIPLSPRDFRAFSTGPKVLALSIPKAGTNLLHRMLVLLPYMAPQWSYAIDETLPGIFEQLHKTRNGQVVGGHLPWSQPLTDVLKSEGFRIIFVVRDLRDVAVSGMYYITNKAQDQRLHRYFSSLKSNEERLMAYIRGVPEDYYPGGVRPKAWENHTERMLPWLDEPDCLTVRFEDLIGSVGGGSDQRQLATVKAIVEHLGIELPEETIKEVAAKTFYTKARTFRKGQIGDWRNHFTEEHKRAFKEVYEDALVRLGYEKDNDW